MSMAILFQTLLYISNSFIETRNTIAVGKDSPDRRKIEIFMLSIICHPYVASP